MSWMDDNMLYANMAAVACHSLQQKIYSGAAKCRNDYEAKRVHKMKMAAKRHKKNKNNKTHR